MRHKDAKPTELELNSHKTIFEILIYCKTYFQAKSLFEQRGKMATWPSFKNGFTKVSRDLITLIWKKNVYNFNDWSIDAMGIIML